MGLWATRFVLERDQAMGGSRIVWLWRRLGVKHGGQEHGSDESCCECHAGCCDQDDPLLLTLPLGSSAAATWPCVDGRATYASGIELAWSAVKGDCL